MIGNEVQRLEMIRPVFLQAVAEGRPAHSVAIKRRDNDGNVIHHWLLLEETSLITSFGDILRTRYIHSIETDLASAIS